MGTNLPKDSLWQYLKPKISKMLESDLNSGDELGDTLIANSIIIGTFVPIATSSPAFTVCSCTGDCTQFFRHDHVALLVRLPVRPSREPAACASREPPCTPFS